MTSRSKILVSTAGLLIASAALAQTISFDMVMDIGVKLGVFDTKIHPVLEKAEVNEADNIKNIAVAMYQIQMATQPQSRDAHAKGHGCVQAEFTTEKNIPDDLQVGLFANPGKKFDAIIRYSNGAGKTQADSNPDGRGMAVKVIGGAPEGNLLGTGTTQDFMMIDNPEFFIRSIKDYSDFQTALVKQGKADGFILGRAIREALTEAGIPNAEDIADADIARIGAAVQNLTSNPSELEHTLGELFPGKVLRINAALGLKLVELKFKRAPLELKIIGKISQQIGSSVTVPYFSMSSYLLAAKSGDTAVKYSARPVDCSSGQPVSPKAVPENPGADFLRAELNTTLQAAPACYELYVQLLPTDKSPDERRTLVEDSRLDYGTPEIAVAHIVIPTQTMDTPARQQYCENLSYNPWQAGAAHQPLGSMNRARKVAVTFSSIRRHLLSGHDRQEPVSVQDFENLR